MSGQLAAKSHTKLPTSPIEVISSSLVGIATGVCSSFDLERCVSLLLVEKVSREKLTEIQSLALDCLVRTDFDKWVLEREKSNQNLRDDLVKIATITHALLQQSDSPSAANKIDYNSTAHDFGSMAAGIVVHARKELGLSVKRTNKAKG